MSKMLDKLKNLFLVFKKEEKHDYGLALAEPSLLSINKDLENIDKSFNNLRKLVDSGFRIGFDKIPSTYLTDLIESIKEFSVMIEASDSANKIKLTGLLAKMHDNAVKCSAMASFVVNSANPDADLEKLLEFFSNVKSEFKEIKVLL